MQYSGKSILDTLKYQESVIDDLNTSVKQISFNMTVIDIMVSIMLIILATFIALLDTKLFNVVQSSCAFTIVLCLLFAVISMRRAVLKSGIAKPNDFFIVFHLINFLIFLLISITYTAFVIFELPHSYIFIGECSLFVSRVYMDCFLLCLIWKYLDEDNRILVTDPLLGKKVPNIVYLRNSKLLMRSVEEYEDHNY